jgi:hypothetical protein
MAVDIATRLRQMKRRAKKQQVALDETALILRKISKLKIILILSARQAIK